MSSKVTGWAWEQELPVQRKCVLLWLAERATDNGVCFPGQTEIRQKTGLSESMVRRYLHWLAADHDDDGRPKPSLVRIIQRPVAGGRNTSNIYVLLVPWARHVDVRRELEELKYVPPRALAGVGRMDAPQWVAWMHPSWVAPVPGKNRHVRTVTWNPSPMPPRTTSRSRGFSEPTTAQQTTQPVVRQRAYRIRLKP